MPENQFYCPKGRTEGLLLVKSLRRARPAPEDAVSWGPSWAREPRPPGLRPETFCWPRTWVLFVRDISFARILSLVLFHVN